MITKKALDRRTLLRGAGVAFSLPLLDAMLPAMTAQAKTVANPSKLKRIGYVYVPMGYYSKEWKPSGPTLESLPASLSPLQSLSNDITILTGWICRMRILGHMPLRIRHSKALREPNLRRVPITIWETTVDQIAAKQIGAETQLPSLELSMDLLSIVGQCDNGYACVYQNNLSWSSPTTPLPAEAHPRLVFESLFGEGGNSKQRQEALRQKASLLDSVTQEIARLKQRVGAADRDRIEKYLENVRDVENRIQKAERGVLDNPLPDLDRPKGVPALYADHARLMFDLQLLAFQGDITRVTTFQLAREASNRTYPEIGVPDPHHPITHHGGDLEKLQKVAKINQFHVSLFAEFLNKLKSTTKRMGVCWITRSFSMEAAWETRMLTITRIFPSWSLVVQKVSIVEVGTSSSAIQHLYPISI